MRGTTRGLTRRAVSLALVIGLLAGLAGAGCSPTSRSTESFCERLGEVTGPGGAEVAFGAGDPERIGAIIDELNSLLDRAPDDIATTTATMLDFFEAYQRAPRDERRELLVEREAELAVASAHLTTYAFDECGLLLQRVAPTPIATSDPGIEVAPE